MANILAFASSYHLPAGSPPMYGADVPRHVAPHPLVAPPSAVDDSQLADTIHSIASPDLNAAIRAMSLISNAIVSGRAAALSAHEQRLVSAVATQIRRLRTSQRPPHQTLPAYKCIAQALIACCRVGTEWEACYPGDVAGGTQRRAGAGTGYPRSVNESVPVLMVLRALLRMVQQQDHMHTRLRHMLREGEGGASKSAA
ncbi:hypothetical protein MSG28_009205 [Choristoneura fumiferana]|uniref:Uncharacterized protein n=1 Tax=Choristoneura fumiferana TaxID=7141 RepID=A0ACC0KX83_CHOFU|nr:hypothetical protein MSG28_009205 [Choristoneura fumiferana]